MKSPRNHKSQKLLPLLTERLKEAKSIPRSSNPLPSKKEKRRHLQNKYFKDGSSWVNLYAFNSLKPECKSNSLSKLLTNCFKEYAPHEVKSL